MAGNLPVGFRFRPTEEELINLLWLKVTSQQLPPTDVVEKNLYGDNAMPWKVFSDDDHWQIFDENGEKSTKRMVYVFNKLFKMSAKKIARTAGCGKWDGQAKGKDIRNFRGEIIGSKKTLSYVLNSGSQAVKGGWTMHEYSLADVGLNGIDSTDYVICRIIRDDKKWTKLKAPSIKRGLTAAADEEEEEVQESMRCPENPTTPEGLGKRKPSFHQENSQPSKLLRENIDAEVRSMNGDDLATVTGDGIIELPNLANFEGQVISSQVMCDELTMDGQMSYTNLLFEGTDQSVNLIGWKSDCFGLDDNHVVESTALLSERFIQEDGGLIHPEAQSNHMGHWSAQNVEQSLNGVQGSMGLSEYPITSSDVYLGQRKPSFQEQITQDSKGGDEAILVTEARYNALKDIPKDTDSQIVNKEDGEAKLPAGFFTTTEWFDDSFQYENSILVDLGF